MVDTFYTLPTTRKSNLNTNNQEFLTTLYGQNVSIPMNVIANLSSSMQMLNLLGASALLTNAGKKVVENGAIKGVTGALDNAGVARVGVTGADDAARGALRLGAAGADDATKASTKAAESEATKSRVLSNIAKSKNARESSNFGEYAAKEKSVLGEVAKNTDDVSTETKLLENKNQVAGLLEDKTASTTAKMPTQTVAQAAQNILDDVKKSRSTAQTAELNSLINELKQTNPNVKITTENVISMAKTNEGKVVWLERGVTDAEAKALGRNSGGAGLAHILERHTNDFAKVGISQAEIQDVVIQGVTKGKIIGYQGKGTGRPVYEFEYGGKIQKIAIQTSDNGFIIGANPNPNFTSAK